MIRAVGFDLDYTLAVPERDRATLLDEAVEAVGAPAISRGEYLDAHADHLVAETREPIFAALLDGRDDVDPADLAAAYRGAVERALVALPGAADMVSSLREEYRVGLLTDGPSRAQRGKLEALGWTDLFDAVVVTGDLSAGKPAPETFDALLSALDAVPAETAYVGDHPEYDVAGAAAAGLRAVQVLYDDGPPPHPDAAATVERDELAERLPAVLRSLGG